MMKGQQPTRKFMKFFLLNFFVFVLLLMSFFVRFRYQNDAIELPKSYTKLLEDVLLSQQQPNPNTSIFFLETTLLASNKSINAEGYVHLNARQLCAIESAARNNPLSMVFVLVANLGDVNITVDTSNAMLKLLLTYKNVQLRNLNIWTYTAGTPVEEWLKNRNLFQSRYLVSHSSDLLRIVTLFRFGGTYLDIDTVTLRSFQDLANNFIGFQDSEQLGSSVINADANGIGHDVMQICLERFTQHFDGISWASNGPWLVTRALMKYCNVTNFADIFNAQPCNGFKIVAKEDFYAIPWTDWQQYFDALKIDETLRKLQHSHVAHIWNKVSHAFKLKKNSLKCAYSVLAETHCPRVFKTVDLYF